MDRQSPVLLSKAVYLYVLKCVDSREGGKPQYPQKNPRSDRRDQQLELCLTPHIRAGLRFSVVSAQPAKLGLNFYDYLMIM